MANVNRYVLCKNNNNKELVYLNYNLSEGFKFKPKNEVKYNGVKVNENVGSGNLEELANVVNEIEKSNAW